MSVTRRALLSAAAAAVLLWPAAPPAQAVPLAPLGAVTHIGGDKRTNMPIEAVKEVLRNDLAVGQYFVTGKLTPEIFADDCRFNDPTNDVTGLSKYVKALGLLFDPKFSRVELLGISVTGPNTIEADWKLGGYLVFPWHPKVDAFQGHTVYTTGPDGLIVLQDQTWSISAAEALRETFTPTPGPQSGYWVVF